MEHDLNILMIFGIQEKIIILSHTMYCCLLLQIYLCYLWLLLCCRDTYAFAVIWDISPSPDCVLSLSHITHSWLSFNELLMQILCSWSASDPNDAVKASVILIARGSVMMHMFSLALCRLPHCVFICVCFRCASCRSGTRRRCTPWSTWTSSSASSVTRSGTSLESLRSFRRLNMCF